MDKIIYKGTSNLESLQSILLRAGFLFAIAYLVFIFGENPPVIAVLIIICFLSFIYMGNDEIIIYADRLVQTDTSIAVLFIKSEKIVYHLSDIKAASLPEKQKRPGLVATSIIILLLSILPKQKRYTTKNHFYLSLTNGDTITLFTSLGKIK